MENRAGRLALRCLALGREEADWRGRTVSRALERRPANVSFSSAWDMQGGAVMWEDEEDRPRGGVEGCFWGTARGEGALLKAKEEGGTQTDMLRLRRQRDAGCRPGRSDGRRWDQHEKHKEIQKKHFKKEIYRYNKHENSLNKDSKTTHYMSQF